MLKYKKFSYKGYPPEFDEKFKREIRRRDQFVCAICQQRCRLDVHHIDYVKEHTTRLNCISLCRDCHFQIHRATWIVRQAWKYTLWRLAAAREQTYYG